MEIGTVAGLILGFGAMIVAMILEGGNPASLLNVPAAVIVLGGTLGATLISYPLKLVTSIPTLFMQSLKGEKIDPAAQIETFIELADQARREGLLSLEERARQLDDEFIRKGVMLVVDGVDPAVVREILETDTALVEKRHRSGQAMFKAMGAFAPTMGIIGTVMGLINVLSHLSNPEGLGHSIAVAFIATLYGVSTANLLWLPIGNKLVEKSQVEVLARDVALEGVLAIQAGDNPRIVREKLESFLAPKLRQVSSEQ